MTGNTGNTSIQRKLMNVILLSCAVVVFLMCTAYLVFEFFTFRDTMRSQVATLAAVVASNSTSSLAFADPKDAEEILSAFKEEKHIVAACLYDTTGKLFASYPAGLTAGQLPGKPGKHKFTFSAKFMDGFQPVIQGKDKLGTLYIKSDLNAMYGQLKKFGLVALILFISSMILAYFVSEILQKSISKPILSLEQTAKVITRNRDYSVRAVKSGEDEVGSLTDAFNQMLSTLESQNQEITFFNQQLELKIAERTHALKEANETLRQQKEFVETIINSSIDIVAVFDKNLNCVMLNKRADEFYEKKDDNTVIGKNLLEIIPPIKETVIYRDLHLALNGQAVNNASFRSERLNRHFEYYHIPLLDNASNVYGVLSIIHDISNIMESHEKLAEVNRELVKSNRDLEQFAYIASHDLQEPLRKIQVFTQLLGENMDNKEELARYQDKIYQSANRMQELIQDVLNFSRISRTEDAFVQTDLNQVIKSLKNDFELTLEETGGVIHCEKLPLIAAIPLQMSQLFSNLISNSLKYIDKKPVINISSEKPTQTEIKMNPKLHAATEYVKINYRDNGIGFDPKYNEQVFTIFQRLHGRQSYSGTGIGLAICRKIVESHNGIITANGEPGIGTTFSIILPVDHQHVPQSQDRLSA